jgi:hypothetical protein
MIYYVNTIEEINAIRSAILDCASELTAAVNCEKRFDDKLIDDTMSTLAEVIKHANDDLKGSWFSAQVKVPEGRAQLLTTPDGRRVSN